MRMLGLGFMGGVFFNHEWTRTDTNYYNLIEKYYSCKFMSIRG